MRVEDSHQALFCVVRLSNPWHGAHADDRRATRSRKGLEVCSRVKGPQASKGAGTKLRPGRKERVGEKRERERGESVSAKDASRRCGTHGDGSRSKLH